VSGHCSFKYLRAYTPIVLMPSFSVVEGLSTMAVRWGAMRTNPLIGLEKPKRQPRRRYVSNDEYTHVWNLASPMVRCVMDLAMLTALRRGDIFRIERCHITNDGLYVKPGKTQSTTGVELLFEWTPALRNVVGQALSLKPQVRQWVVCNRKREDVHKERVRQCVAAPDGQGYCRRRGY